MNTVYLNGEYLPQDQAKISPLDRGFLFGDGIYEVVPLCQGKLLCFDEHIARLRRGLAALQIQDNWNDEQWRSICHELIARNTTEHKGVYIQISRGADQTRSHAYPKHITPTVFAMLVVQGDSGIRDLDAITGASVITRQDLRWKHCDIKSTSLLGNLMHFQQAIDSSVDEVILLNEQKQVTECASCNVFVVKDGVIMTPIKDNAILPGITRDLVVKLATLAPALEVRECRISEQQLQEADEVWISSSTREVLPVVTVDGKPVNDGTMGPLWREIMERYQDYKAQLV